MKVCRTCGEGKPLELFCKKGLKCRSCAAEYLRQYRIENKTTLNEKQRTKWAAMSDEERLKEAERARQRYRRNEDAELRRGREKYQRTKEKVIERTKAYGERRPEVRRAATKKWRAANPQKVAVQKAKRYARTRAIPAWADRQLMEDIYTFARIMRQYGGIDVHVDHEVPLRGKLVSGLHVHNNLSVVPAIDNQRKHAKWQPE